MQSAFKVYLILFHVFFVLYAGIGLILYNADSLRYIQFFFFIITFNLFGYIYYKSVNKFVFKGEGIFYHELNNIIKKYSSFIIALYFILYLFVFIYPSNRMFQLVSIPSFDFLSAFESRFDGESNNTVSTIVVRVRRMLFPLVLIALAQYKIRYVVLFIVVNMYISYANTAYIGRGAFVLNFIALIYLIYTKDKALFRKTILITLLATPLISWLFFQFTYFRLGAEYVSVGYFDSIYLLLINESRTIQYGETALLYQSKNILIDYYKWLFTIPIPTVMLPFNVLELNYVIGSDVLNVSPGERGFYVSLVGLMYESLYLYGNTFFVIHAVLVQYITISLFRVFKGINNAQLLYGVLIANSTYALCRAGTSSYMPFAVNTMMLIVLFYIFYIIFQKRLLRA
jgi:hypothetical protein